MGNWFSFQVDPTLSVKLADEIIAKVQGVGDHNIIENIVKASLIENLHLPKLRMSWKGTFTFVGIIAVTWILSFGSYYYSQQNSTILAEKLDTINKR